MGCEHRLYTILNNTTVTTIMYVGYAVGCVASIHFNINN